MKNYLAFEYRNFNRDASYMGFEKGGTCAHPTQTYYFYKEKKDEFKCEFDQSGNYNPKCRPWYIN